MKNIQSPRSGRQCNQCVLVIATSIGRSAGSLFLRTLILGFRCGSTPGFMLSAAPRAQGFLFVPGPGVSLRSTPGFMLSAAPRAHRHHSDQPDRNLGTPSTKSPKPAKRPTVESSRLTFCNLNLYRPLRGLNVFFLFLVLELRYASPQALCSRPLRGLNGLNSYPDPIEGCCPTKSVDR